jgi:hypothetical protein
MKVRNYNKKTKFNDLETREMSIAVGVEDRFWFANQWILFFWRDFPGSLFVFVLDSEASFEEVCQTYGVVPTS